MILALLLSLGDETDVLPRNLGNLGNPPLDPGDVCDLSSFGSVHIVQTATFNSDVALLAALHILCHQRK